ncbi:hypothetical protein PAXRUDRAFT_16020 [Paxillus rubicundulus Ve08.2h10]|uniref:Uncharacterized protein n=1 Tax=Paxillus rubicundulus Ve08.2h10 TaxID=930991 RepID=A0A0D0CWU8_9AGAM|nr:hypothetical protein PAXRUDRAFT_16020 [Paxillus rubicundulus Ve08.2h10]
MHVGAVKNGRNFCANHWLQAFKGKGAKASGTRCQFDMYYKSLLKALQDLYNKEADELVANGTWGKATIEKPLY